MADLCDGFVALPGGFGTMDELFEVVTWAQLGLHTKPIGLLDVDGYWDGLVAWVQRAVADGLVPAEHGRLLLVEHGRRRAARRPRRRRAAAREVGHRGLEPVDRR